MTHPTGSSITLQAADGHRLEAWRAAPAGAPRGGVVVLQEIFGLNAHTRHEAERYAADGFLAVAPAMFDRVKPGLLVDYSDVQGGLAAANGIGEEQLVADLQAAVDAAAAAGPVVVVGWCWGGALAYLAACRCRGVTAAVCYYGSRIAQFCERMAPSVPVLYHFGEKDGSLPPEAIAKIAAAHPAGVHHVYPGAGHAFTNSDRASYDAAAATLAHARTLEFIGGSLR